MVAVRYPRKPSHRIRCAVVVITLIALACRPVAAQEESVLKGLGGVRLEILGDDLPVPVATLQADAEQGLRQAGVIVDPLRAARLRLLIAILRPDGLPANYIYSAQLQLDERVLTRRGLSAEVVTWESKVVVGLALRDDAGRFHAVIQELVHEFITAYLAANPK